MSANGGPVTRLTKPGPGGVHEPEEWSPTGETLLFSVQTKSREISLWTYSLPDRRVARFGKAQSNFPIGERFSRDGSRVAYSERTSDKARIYVEEFLTGNRVELPISGANLVGAQDRLVGNERRAVLRSQDSRVRGRRVRDPPDVQVW